MKLGVCYYPEHWPESQWESDARRMAFAGISQVRIAEFAWAKIEPEPGTLSWDWLDRAIDTLARHGLKLVLGTPTATPPRWLVDQHPDILAVDAAGNTRIFGSRRHYCFSSEAYFAASKRIVTLMAERYGNHPAVIAWQTDNEYGCHDTIVSYSSEARRRFRQWLQARYGDIAALNKAWGNDFWSMDYQRFEQIEPPINLPTFVNPIHGLDYRRFASDEAVRYNRMQVEILRKHSPGRDVLHNFMAFFTEFEHNDMAKDLDAASWDSYPLGNTDSASYLNDAEKLAYARTGHPDISAFNHDLYRGLGRGRWWVMEQQPGPVNWADWNPAPLPGMVRAWSWEAFAHGAEVVSYFRWRQCPFAQEQMHAGLNTPDDRLDIGGHEAAQVAREIAQLAGQADTADISAPARVALVFDYETQWMLRITPQGKDFDYIGLCMAWYGAARRLGHDVDIVSRHADLSAYALVLVPSLARMDEGFVNRAAASGAQLVFGPRSGNKTRDFAIPAQLPPGPLANLLPLRVWRVDAMRPGLVSAVLDATGAHLGEASRWRDYAEAGAGTEVLARFDDGHPALLRKGASRYLAGWLDNAGLDTVIGAAARDAGLATERLPEGLRLRRRGRVQFAINYGPQTASVPAPAGTAFLLGARELPVTGVAAWLVD
ncbi:beta-galactosidase [Niveibacterium sp. SC-1]|uniref:beta-galactosidase n=1 Tax=Niveibacterium sp. SC-1 TaxID=3135646 RepID=UPI00311ED730